MHNSIRAFVAVHIRVFVATRIRVFVTTHIRAFVATHIRVFVALVFIINSATNSRIISSILRSSGFPQLVWWNPRYKTENTPSLMR